MPTGWKAKNRGKLSIGGRRSVRDASGQCCQTGETDHCGPASKGEGNGHRMNAREFSAASILAGSKQPFIRLT
jgi:hypothetical protein